MTQKLSDEDIDRIAEAVAKKEACTFYVDPRDHYSAHERIDSLLKAYDTASNIVLKAILAFFIVGIIGVVAFGAGWHK